MIGQRAAKESRRIAPRSGAGGQANKRVILMNKTLLIPALISMLLTSAALAQTPVGGLILTDTTWNLAGNPYIVTQSIIIGGSATLTIDPGVQVRFYDLTSIVVGSPMFGTGTLVARGLSGQPITFTADNAPAPGKWSQILFSDEAADGTCGPTGDYVSGSVLEQCVVEYGGNSSPCVMLDKASPYICETVIRFSGSTGLKADLSPGATATPRLLLRGNTMQDCAFRGADIYNGAADIKFGLIQSNVSTGLYLSQAHGSVVADNIIHGNGAGGMHVLSSASVTIANNHIDNNNADYEGGGGVLLSNSQNVVVDHNVVTHNQAMMGPTGPNGGGLWIVACLGCSVTRNLISENYSHSLGGGMCIFDGDVTLDENIFSLNAAKWNGGGLHVGGATVSVSGGSFINNSASTGGGLCAMGYAGGVSLLGCSFVGNAAAQDGGGVYHSIVLLSVVDSVFALNSAVNGGGLYVNATGVQIAGDKVNNVFNTFVDNTATKGSAVYLNTAYGSNLMATYVCWGTDSIGDVPTMLWDFFDNSSLGMVVFYTAPGDLAHSDPLYDVGAGVPGVTGVPILTGTGTLLPGAPTLISLSNAAPSAPMVLLFGFSPMYYTGFLDAVVVPLPAVIFSIATSPSGTLNVPFSWPTTAPSGTTVFWQAIIMDVASPNGTASFSNAVYSVSP